MTLQCNVSTLVDRFLLWLICRTSYYITDVTDDLTVGLTDKASATTSATKSVASICGYKGWSLDRIQQGDGSRYHLPKIQNQKSHATSRNCRTP